MLSNILAFIISFEGFHPVAYADHKQMTHGFGTRATESICITKEHAMRELAVHVQNSIKLVDRPELTDNQVVALASFSYNVGPNAYKNSKVAKLVKQGRICAASKELGTWIRAGGKVAGGLVKRRAAEAELLTRGMEC